MAAINPPTLVHTPGHHRKDPPVKGHPRPYKPARNANGRDGYKGKASMPRIKSCTGQNVLKDKLRNVEFSKQDPTINPNPTVARLINSCLYHKPHEPTPDALVWQDTRLLTSCTRSLKARQLPGTSFKGL